VKKVLAVVVAALATLTLALPASAVHTEVRDGDDTPGKLDLRRVEMRQGPPRKWVLKTHGGFHAGEIFDKGYLLVYFDTFGTKRFDYYVLLRPTRSRIKGSLWKDAKSPNNDVFLSNTRVRKPNKRTVSTTVPFRKMRTPDGRLTYRWHARTIYTGPKCRRVCIDRAPDNSSIHEPYVPTP
jgi:hypothetical protein